MKYYIILSCFVFLFFINLNKISKEEAYQQPQFEKSLQIAIETTTNPLDKSGVLLATELTLYAIQKYPNISSEQLKFIYHKSMINNKISKIMFFIHLHTTLSF
jgi:hypothetical protein